MWWYVSAVLFGAALLTLSPRTEPMDCWIVLAAAAAGAILLRAVIAVRRVLGLPSRRG